MMAVENPEFELLPVDDEGLSPAEDRAAAIAGAIAEPGVIVPQAEEVPRPFGRTWVFDFQKGRFVREGGSPAPTSGFGAVEQWVLMAVHSARFAHRVFAEDFGMEHPEDAIGELFTAAIVSDYQQRLTEAVLVHDRITDLDGFKAEYDPVDGLLRIDQFEIVTDEEGRVPFRDIIVERTE